ncbi:MAG TPA: long-chain fatty acid--CoA ligase [Gallionellaceae bacterium]|nr:long-chain fatty acid--CoA ligase [Gallionellaceae bacterium]
MHARTDLIAEDVAVTLDGLFAERVRRSPDRIAYRHFDEHRCEWQELSWREMEHEIARWQAAMEREGLRPGDRVAIMLKNCPQWVVFDQAALGLGLVSVPLYVNDRPENVAYVLQDSGAKLLLIDNATHWHPLHEACSDIDSLTRIVTLRAPPEGDNDERLRSVDEWLPEQSAGFRHLVSDPNELATIVYTSGTTGRPKGVMLSHINILSNAHASMDIIAVRGDDLLLSFLPLSHTFERTLGYYLPVMTGSTVAFARSIPQLAEDLQTIRPTILISVPRIYERMYAAIRAKLDEGSPLARWLFHLAVETGWARFEQEQGRGPWKASFLLWPLLQKLVAQKVLDRLGGRLRVAVSGGAALAPEISRVFIALGLPVVQGYGLTETSPVISGNRLENNFPDSVGQPIRDVQVRLGEQSALLVKGPNVMLGYWNNPEVTRDMIDSEGWLNTGDVAHISDSGHIYITGRIKDIIVMSNGEKVPPTDMELALLHDPLFDQVMVFGEAHPYLVVLAVLNNEAWQHFAREIGIRADIPEALNDSRVEAKILRRVARNLRGFPGYARVNRVLLLREPWSVENGLLTPTLKIKRTEIAQQFAAQIKELYGRR